MRKMRLDVSALEVDSFDTGTLEYRTGTVNGHIDIDIVVDDTGDKTMTVIGRPWTAVWHCSGCSALDANSCIDTMNLSYQPICPDGVYHTYEDCDTTKPRVT